MKNITILLLLFLLPVGGAYGQVPEAPQALPSPIASGLGLYGEIPVSHFTGTPSIQVPLYDLQVGKYRLPLSLSYHASGVRPDQHPGWLGMGWSLSANAVITRVVHDLPDEYNRSLSDYTVRAGYYFNHSILNKANWNTRNYLRQVAQSAEGDKDTEPDEFSFNFLGYTGKFLLTHTGEWEVQCDKPVKVEFKNKFVDTPFRKAGTQAVRYGYNPTFEGFTLTTEDGTRYVFGGNVNAIEYSVGFFEQVTQDWCATSWNLTKIIYTDGQEVTYSYDRGDFINQMYYSLRLNLRSYTESSGILNPECSFGSIVPYKAGYQGKLIAPVYLKEIVASDIHISFSRSKTTELRYKQDIYQFQRNAWSGLSSLVRPAFLPYLLTDVEKDEYPQCLDKLIWYDLSQITINDISKKTHHYFIFNYNNDGQQRLTLSSVFQLFRGNRTNLYSFSYKNAELLPEYLSNQIDHWGFYNATSAPLNYADYYSYREPKAACLQYGILDKIKYPTKGYTRFIFEPHDYSKQLRLNRWETCEQLSANKMAGGLRVKKIVNSATGNEADEVTAKEYFYSTDYLQHKENAHVSSGILGGRAQYYFTNYKVWAFDIGNVKHIMDIFSTQSVLPVCENSMGSHIGYTEVYEKRADGSLIRYKYTNFDNGHLDAPADANIQESQTPYSPYTSKAVERGRLILQEEYTSADLLKRKRLIGYEKSYKPSGGYVRSMVAHYKNVCPNTAVSYDEGTTYRINTYTYRKTSERDSLFDDRTNPIVSYNLYQYDNMGLLNRVTKEINNGKKEISYKHPYDSSTDVCMAMVAQHVLSPIVEEKVILSTDGKNYPLERHSYEYTPINKVSDRMFAVRKIEKEIAGASLRETYICHNYDTKGKPLFVTENAMNTVYLWGNDSQRIFAVIRNATLDDVQAIIGPVDDFSSARIPNQEKLDLLRKFLNKAQITTYTYNPLYGVDSITDPQGKSIYYEYDLIGRLNIQRNFLGNAEKVYEYRFSTN